MKSFQLIEFKTDLFEYLPSYLQDHSREIIIYGAGAIGTFCYEIFKRHRMNVRAFSDMNEKLHGKMKEGLTVLPPTEISKNPECDVFIAIQQNPQKIKQSLVHLGLSARHIFLLPEQMYEYYTYHVTRFWPEQDLAEHTSDLTKAFELLEDQKSRDVFTNYISLLANMPSYGQYKLFLEHYSDAHALEKKNYGFENQLYFNNDVFELDDEEILIDAGAYHGDSLDEFILACEKKGVSYVGVHCFEPDETNFNILKEKSAHLKNVFCYNSALGNKKEKCPFISSGSVLSPAARLVGGYGDHYFEDDSFVQVVRLDDEIRNQKITLIKMDVEGGELNCLKGMVKTIMSYKPRLIVSLYHKRDDIFELMLFIHKIRPDYKFYIRSFSLNLNEIVLIAL